MLKLLAILVLSTGFLFAQEGPLRGPVRDSNPQAGSPKDYQGCVIRSTGKILLTDSQGTEYYLVSSSKKLDSYLGEEVRITAVDMNSGDPTSGERSVESGRAHNRPATLDVETIEKTADHCASPK